MDKNIRTAVTFAKRNWDVYAINKVLTVKQHLISRQK